MHVMVHIEVVPSKMHLDYWIAHVHHFTFELAAAVPHKNRSPPACSLCALGLSEKYNIPQRSWDGPGPLKKHTHTHSGLGLIYHEGPLHQFTGNELGQLGILLGIEVMGIHQTSAATPDFSKVCEEFPVIFNTTLGLYNGFPVSLQLDPAVHPILLKAHGVPFTLKPKIDEEFDRLLAQGVLEPVSHGARETSIVILVKLDGSVCICVDYKCTLNKALKDHAYLITMVSHVLSMLTGAKIFGKLDLSQAYLQVLIDEATADVRTIITHWGAFRVKRLQFGVSVTP